MSSRIKEMECYLERKCLFIFILNNKNCGLAYNLLLLLSMKKACLLLIVFISIFTEAQTIKSVQLRPLNNSQFTPFMPLGAPLLLSFDDLDADNKEYQYKIEHMTYDWKPSNLATNQYINGFDQNYLNDVTNSFNTLQNYTHYKLVIPNQNTVITKSGNYLISILDTNDTVIFKRRFVLYENLTQVGVAVFRSRDVNRSDKDHLVQLIVNYPNIRINNPAQDIKISIIQNGQWNFLINNITPSFYKPNQLVYNDTNLLNFEANNEYLNFDTKNIRMSNLNIAHVERKQLFETYLYTQTPRKETSYTYQPDINGAFVINSVEANDNSTEADYSRVHFSLSVTEPYLNKDIYVYGAFNNYKLTPENKMLFNPAKNTYDISIVLKQGFYNYGFTTLDSNKTLSLSTVDGSYFETENEYTVFIYYRPFGEVYDRVIGMGQGYFNQNR